MIYSGCTDMSPHCPVLSNNLCGDRNVKSTCCYSCKKKAEKDKKRVLECKDTHKNCEPWADAGHCKIVTVKKRCRLSCEVCRAKDAETTKNGLPALCLRSKKYDTTGGGRRKRAGCLNSANWYRAKHENTNNLKWDHKLASAAQRYAYKLASYGTVVHDTQNTKDGVGENIYQLKHKRGRAPAVSLCALAHKNWYSEIFNYDFAKGASLGGKEIGHFAQMVWKESTKVGYGVSQTRLYGGWTRVYVVARYIKARENNYGMNKHKDNVGKRASTECIERPGHFLKA